MHIKITVVNKPGFLAKKRNELPDNITRGQSIK